VAEEGPDGEEAVGVADFFSFGGGAGGVGNGDFGDFFAEAAELGGDFGAEFEAVAFEIDLR
jgi:hypothetical protein